ncbi:MULTISPECIES: GNAT family N-acetyltransferase [Polyangium]|uniref:GNAT family N-acetyltransferase n=2 Tax=Polyangium TaxID=55 RepID=A0A4U1J5G0_9BACT|nr:MULTISPECIES: GNAT family N-acetyltransferase [Polyangium]MDI1432711.1 GNAT family N-acetyltransferase [Polyangium sorediatum]TKD01973.1 GNAT family N-acetyltransferase [Polyangium fumosum]
MRTAEEIARLEEARQVQGFASIAPESIRVAGGIACFAGPGSWCNVVVGIGLAGPVSAEELDRIEAFYAGRGVPIRMELSPYVDAGLLAMLTARRFVLTRFENLLARDLSADEDSLAGAALPEGIVVRKVAPGEEDRFVDVSSSGFRPEGEPMSEADRQVSLAMVKEPRSISVMAWAGDEAVGAGSAEVRGEVAALFGTSVLPAWRKRGIQQALIRARLAEARARGATVATIGSMPGEPTERNVQRVGFRVVCTRVHLERA